MDVMSITAGTGFGAAGRWWPRENKTYITGPIVSVCVRRLVKTVFTHRYTSEVKLTV